MSRLGQSTTSFEERRTEANRLLEMIRSVGASIINATYSEVQIAFLKKCADQDQIITPSMIFYLRDLKDKIL